MARGKTKKVTVFLKAAKPRGGEKEQLLVLHLYELSKKGGR